MTLRQAPRAKLRFECYRLPAAGSLMRFIEEHAVEGVAPAMTQLREQMGDDMAREVLGDHWPLLGDTVS